VLFSILKPPNQAGFSHGLIYSYVNISDVIYIIKVSKGEECEAFFRYETRDARYEKAWVFLEGQRSLTAFRMTYYLNNLSILYKCGLIYYTIPRGV